MKTKICRRWLSKRLTEVTPGILSIAIYACTDAADFPLDIRDAFLNLIANTLHLLLDLA